MPELPGWILIRKFSGFYFQLDQSWNYWWLREPVDAWNQWLKKFLQITYIVADHTLKVTDKCPK